jgi:hypothetical protein
MKTTSRHWSVDSFILTTWKFVCIVYTYRLTYAYRSTLDNKQVVTQMYTQSDYNRSLAVNDALDAMEAQRAARIGMLRDLCPAQSMVGVRVAEVPRLLAYNQALEIAEEGLVFDRLGDIAQMSDANVAAILAKRRDVTRVDVPEVAASLKRIAQQWVERTQDQYMQMKKITQKPRERKYRQLAAAVKVLRWCGVATTALVLMAAAGGWLPSNVQLVDALYGTGALLLLSGVVASMADRRLRQVTREMGSRRLATMGIHPGELAL